MKGFFPLFKCLVDFPFVCFVEFGDGNGDGGTKKGRQGWRAGVHWMENIDTQGFLLCCLLSSIRSFYLFFSFVLLG